MPILEVAHYPLRIRSVRGYCCFVVEKFSTLTRHQVSNNEQHNPRNSVHFELHGIRDRNDREIRSSCHRPGNRAG